MFTFKHLSVLYQDYACMSFIGDVFYKRADLIIAPLIIRKSRSLGIDYLPPIAINSVGIYIPNQDKTENINFDTFFQPFTSEMWAMTFVSTITITMIKLTLSYKFGKIEILDFIGVTWTTFVANFGGKPKNNLLDSRQSYKILIFTSLFCGTIIWIGYRSYLSAALSIILKKYPFNDMESFSRTDWRFGRS